MVNFNELHGFCYEFQAALSATVRYWITPDQMLSIRFNSSVVHIQIRIRISMLMSIEIRGLASKQCRSSCGSYPKFYICWISDFFTYSHYIASLQCFIFFISVRCVIWFQYFGHFHLVSHRIKTKFLSETGSPYLPTWHLCSQIYCRIEVCISQRKYL
jgi:hypothetical protein